VARRNLPGGKSIGGPSVTDRLLDYGLVALVVVIVAGLFRCSRIIMRSFLKRLESTSPLSADRILRAGFLILLAGLLMLPFLTSLLAFASSAALPGGMPLHLTMVAFSIILFSIAEDLFRSFRAYPRDATWTVGRHIAFMSVPLIAFWAVGCLLLSPIFYSGLSIILALFYLYSIGCMPVTDAKKE
jgi:hypothetical protein